jgi:putative DNA-invertase from lambdoid prophage Rac
MRVAVYHRVSTLDQDPAAARAELRAAAKQRGWEVALVVEETGSGARADRPGLKKVMKAALRGQVGAVMAWKLFRFGRSALDVLGLVEDLTDAGAHFVCVSQGLHIKPHGDAMSNLMMHERVRAT